MILNFPYEVRDMFISTDGRNMTLGELISACYEELAAQYPSSEELAMAVAARLEELLSGYDAQLV